MNIQLRYVPILRVRQQEIIVLKSFDFGDRIYPYLEIIKELDRILPKQKTKSQKPANAKKIKLFEDVYLPLIKSIKAKKVFVDLPVHLKEYRGMKKDTLVFLRTVVALRSKRTEYLKRLIELESKIIPVISTYFQRTNERDSIILQTNDLRPHFKTLAFRTFPKSFFNDIEQIDRVALPTDYLIVDFGNEILDSTNCDQQEIIDRLKTTKCIIITHRNPIPKEITNVGLAHNRRISSVDNSLLEKFGEFNGSGFSDYAGIKKDDIGDGGTISPGFIFYDAVENNFYGYKGKKKELKEFELTIVPDVINSNAAQRMQKHNLDYLGLENTGWKIINNINQGIEPGKSPAKFKRIGLEHYLYCLKVKISNGDFDSN